MSDVSRRTFISQVAGGSIAAGAALASKGASAAAAGAPRYGMVIDTRRCTGCHACSVACKAEFEVPLGETRSWVEYIEKGTYPAVSRSFLPRLCNQCEEPGCVDVCPTGATYQRADGIVAVDADACIGCKYCMQACPYGARYINPVSGTADKCDFCAHRVSQGVAPACVNTCVGKARIFGDLNDPNSEISRVLATESVSVLRPEMGTQPSVYYIDADHSDPRTARAGEYIHVTTNRRQQERV